MIPSTRTLYVERDGKAVPEVVAVPEVNPDEVLIAVKAVSMNPIDYSQVAMKWSEGSGIGCNFAGEIIHIGKDVKEWAIGDTTAGGVSGSDVDRPSEGAFSDYIVVRAALLFKLPVRLTTNLSDSIPVGFPDSFEQASTLGLTMETAAIGFEFNDQIPMIPNSQSGFVIIYSAASSLGISLCQIAKYMGYTVIALASAKNFDDLRLVGADHVLDYHDDDWQEQVNNIAGDDVILGFDCYSKQESQEAVWEVLSTTKPATLSVFLIIPPPIKIKANATCNQVVYFHMFNDTKKLGPNVVTASPSVIPYVPKMLEHLDEMFAINAVKAQKTTVVGNSLKDIPHALDLMSKGVSNEKLVVRLQ